MEPVIVLGYLMSSYVRTARMTCLEKGAPHRFEAIPYGSEDLVRLHPFRKVPVMRHGDVELFETSAMCRYIDEVFDGPSLVPATTARRARMEQWISAVNAYVYQAAIRDYVLEYVLPSMAGKAPDRAKIEAGLDAMRYVVAQLDRAYEGREWIADTFSLADLFVGPVLTSLLLFPEGREVVERSKELGRVVKQLRARKCGELIDPQPPSA